MEEYLDVKRGREYQGCAVGKYVEKGETIYSFLKYQGYWKENQVGKRGLGPEKLGEENQDLKIGEEYQIVGNYIHPCNI